MSNHLYFGDNLDVLREHIDDESVDLIYLDPPFNSKRDYNLLFKTPKGHESDAQITAFEDSWHWGEQAEREFREIEQQSNTDVAEMMMALRSFLGENDMMAYLTMMANRLLELHRVLKPTGSIYLHCDPTASHYLKVVMDGVFGVQQFRNEICWRRSFAHGDGKQGSRHFGRVVDSILFYSRSDEATWNPLYENYSDEALARDYKYVDPTNGRKYRLTPLDGPGGAAKGNPEYTFMGVHGFWRYSETRMQELADAGRIVLSRTGKSLSQKRYLDEAAGRQVDSLWVDIHRLSPNSSERLGYPTQKPIALLERIIAASSNAGDLVLDPFCGCGTAVHAAEKLGRHWIGIDITHLAISLIEKRLRDAFPAISFEVHGTPRDLDGARDLAERDKYQFQWWACSLVDAQPYQGKKKGSDGGIDGVIYFHDESKGTAKKIVVSVKGGGNVSVSMVRDLGHVVEREKAAIGLFVTLAEPTGPMTTEAVKAGYYQSPNGHEYPKLQILTIEELLSGAKRPRYPYESMGSQTFKKAKRETKGGKQSDLFE